MQAAGLSPKKRHGGRPKKENVSTSDSASDTPKMDHQWSLNDSLRLLHVLADPASILGLRQLMDGISSRSDLDTGRHKQSPFAEGGDKEVCSGIFFLRFNDPTVKYDLPEYSEMESHYPDVYRYVKTGKLLLSFQSRRSSEKLKEHYDVMKTRYGTKRRNWDQTGNHGEGTFHLYSKGIIISQSFLFILIPKP